MHLLSALRALIFLARRIQPFLSLVDSEVEFCVLTIYQVLVLHPLVIFSFVFFIVKKIPFAGIELMSQRVRRLRGYLWAVGATGMQLLIGISTYSIKD